MKNSILNRILKEQKSSHLLEDLIENMSFSDLQTFLLEVYKEKTKKLSASQLLDQYQNNRFVQPSKVEAKKLREFDLYAFSLLPSYFEILDLSPIAPLGTSSLLALVDQNNILTTIRNTEVISDITNVLALESTLRRKKFLKQNSHSKEKVYLCACQKVVRCQFFSNTKNFFAPFKLFGLTTAGQDEGSFIFEAKALKEQILYYYTLLSHLENFNIFLKDLTLDIYLFDPAQKQKIVEQILEPLSLKIPIQFKEKSSNYYQTLCFQFSAKDSSDQVLLLVDGGFTNWTQKLLNNNKEKLLISGLGTERLLACFST